MTYDPPRPVGRLLLTPEDRDAPERVERLRLLGLGEYAEPSFDAFADRLAEVAAVPYAMVNFIDERRQFFAGLHVSAEPTTDTTVLGVDRHLARDHGFCPYVVVRRKGLVLEDVREYPKFAGTPSSTTMAFAPTSAPLSSTAPASPSARSASWTSGPAPGAGPDWRRSSRWPRS